ncbi:uncharacterized protein LOC132562415 [Ylistrum balloti]|uniref:uncharacterized protein LOC132562415 n=1 Tax=Ylistrum balloti TaxID=509963 RepID=UPI002905D7E2|nr:uncharacterized protein LOC132562415 [Ylistrum balloti]
MEDSCRENGHHKQKKSEQSEGVRSTVSPKSTPRRGRKRKQRFCSPKISPAISIQDGAGLISDDSTAESEGIQSPIKTPRRAKRSSTRESPRRNQQNEHRTPAVSANHHDQPVAKHDNCSPVSIATNNRGVNGDSNSQQSVELSTYNKLLISEEKLPNHGHSRLSNAIEEKLPDQRAAIEESVVYYKEQSSKVGGKWITGQKFLPCQVTRPDNEVLFAEQKAAEVMARMNCLENDEDILDVEKEHSEKGFEESSQCLPRISGNGAQDQGNSSAASTDNGQVKLMSRQATENTVVGGHRIESLNTKQNLPANGDLQKEGEITDINSGQKGTILSSLLEGRDQESLIAAELLTRLDRDIHLSEIQPTICLDQNNYPSYTNIGYGSSSPAANINVSKYLDQNHKKQENSVTGVIHHDNGVDLSLEHSTHRDQASCAFESHSGLRDGDYGVERVSPTNDSLSTPATRQTASQILYQNRVGQEQIGPDCQRSHSFHGSLDSSSMEQGRINIPQPRHSDPGAPGLGWDQSRINTPSEQHNMGNPGWDQRQQSYHHIVDPVNQKDGFQHSVSGEQLSGDQLNSGCRYNQMVAENCTYNSQSNIGAQKQTDNPTLYERRPHTDAIIPVEQGMPFGPMVEDTQYSGLPNFQSGNYLNLSQEAIDNMIQTNRGSSFVGSPSIQSQPLPTNVSTTDPSTDGFGDFVHYARSSQSSEGQVQYFQPTRSKSQGPDEMVTHLAKRRRRSNSNKISENERNPGYVDVMNNYIYKKNDMPYEHALHPLQVKDNDNDRFFLILSPEVNADEVRDIGHKGLIAKYIDYLIVENEQITEMSKAVSIPIEHCVMDDPYLMDIIRVKIPFPTLKYYQWLRTYYPTIQIDWLALNHQMLQFQPVGDCRPHHYILDKRPPPVLLGESFYFFQRERDRLLSC